MFFKCYLEAMDGTGSKNNSHPSSTVTDAPPPVQKPPELVEPPKQQQEEQTPSSPGQYPADEFDDEVRCSALYDFAGELNYLESNPRLKENFARKTIIWFRK